MKSTALFVIAHPDDESYGPAGTIRALCASHNVIIIVMCSGNRPGHEHVSASRIRTFKDNCELLGCKYVMHNNNDLGLDIRVATKLFADAIEQFAPDVVYTHSPSDLNVDHRTVAEAALVACRPTPTCPVKSLLFFEIPAATDWAFGQLGSRFDPTVFVDITEFIDAKQRMLATYTSEVRICPDARSVEAMVDVAKFRGRTVGVRYAEAFQLVYARDHKIL